MSDLIPPGFYNAVAVPTDVDGAQLWAQFGETKNGTKQVVLHFEILDGAHAGKRLPWFGFFTANSADRTIESLRACGFKGDDLALAQDQEMSLRVSVTVEHSTWEGKTRAKIAWVNRPGGGGVKLEKPMDANALRMFSASLKTRVAGKPVVSGEKGEPGKAPPPSDSFEPPPPTDDKLPF